MNRYDWAMRSKVHTLCLIASLVVAGLTTIASAQPPRPEDLLTTQHDLQRLPSTNIWVTSLEQELRTLWQELPQHRDAIILLEQSLSERIDRTRREWQVAIRTEDSLRASLANLTRPGAERSQLERQLQVLRRTAIPPDRLGDMEDVRAQAIQLADHRHSLWLKAQAIREKTTQLDDSYSQLRNSPKVTALLRNVGAKQRLGPAKNYSDDLPKLAEMERPTLTDWAPLYRVGDHLRVSLLANHSTPLTFTWSSSPEPAFITASMAESIGVEPLTNSQPKTVSVGGKTWRARPAVISYLRLGRHELREVEVAILPPDAEAAGARISPEAFKGYRANPQPALLRINLATATELTP